MTFAVRTRIVAVGKPCMASLLKTGYSISPNRTTQSILTQSPHADTITYIRRTRSFTRRLFVFQVHYTSEKYPANQHCPLLFCSRRHPRRHITLVSTRVETCRQWVQCLQPCASWRTGPDGVLRYRRMQPCQTLKQKL